MGQSTEATLYFINFTKPLTIREKLHDCKHDSLVISAYLEHNTVEVVNYKW